MRWMVRLRAISRSRTKVRPPPFATGEEWGTRTVARSATLRLLSAFGVVPDYQVRIRLDAVDWTGAPPQGAIEYVTEPRASACANWRAPGMLRLLATTSVRRKRRVTRTRGPASRSRGGAPSLRNKVGGRMCWTVRLRAISHSRAKVRPPPFARGEEWGTRHPSPEAKNGAPVPGAKDEAPALLGTRMFAQAEACGSWECVHPRRLKPVAQRRSELRAGFEPAARGFV